MKETNMDKKTLLLLLLFLLRSMISWSQPVRNILWDGGLETGYGNSYWGTIRGNYGPNWRSAWSNGMVKLRQTVASRCYWLAEGTYSLCVWVKRVPGWEKEPMGVILLLTNLNYYGDREKNEYRKKFSVPEGEGVFRLGWSFTIKGAVRPIFHVEIAPLTSREGEGLLLDAVSLTPGPELPEKMVPAADVEAGFFIPEETGIYNDGEERIVQLLVSNHGPQRKAKVHWEIYNYLEELVRKGTIEEDLPAFTTIKRNLAVGDLPWNGYRLACEVEGQPVLGDGLVAFLPKINQDSFPLYGGDAAINSYAGDFTGRFLKKLGMKNATTLSCGGGIGRWALVNPEEGKYIWNDELVESARKEGLDVIGFLGLKYPPAWVKEKYMKGSTITEENGFTGAFCRYVEAFVSHYRDKIPVIHFEDEIHGVYPLEQVARIYKAAMDTVRKVAGEYNLKITAGINATRPEWWANFIELVKPEYIDFVSQNTNLRPNWTLQTLNILKEKNCYPEYFYTLGVGQKSVLRKTSLILDRAGSGTPGGLFAWQLMMAAWLSRPYGTEEVRHGPLIRFGYYDLRTLGQAVYIPQAGKTGLEYDNSPTLGLQAMAMQKYWLSGKRPVREIDKPGTLKGYQTECENLFLYPFRDEKKAVIILTTSEAVDLNSRDFDCRWKLSGVDFRCYPAYDIYGQLLPVDTDGQVLVKQLPVVFKDIPTQELNQAISCLRYLKAERQKSPESISLKSGEYFISINPEQQGFLCLIHRKNNQEICLIDGVFGYPALPRPEVETSETRTAASARLNFGPLMQLGIRISPEGVILQWSHSNNETKSVQQRVSFRLSHAGAGREITVQNGDKIIAGKLREDYGELVSLPAPPPAAIPEFACRVSIKGFATFDLSGATGQGGFSPLTGFQWKTRDGEAFLEAAYTIAPYAGGGSRGVQTIHLEIKVTTP